MDIIILIILGNIHRSGLWTNEAMFPAKWFIKQYFYLFIFGGEGGVQRERVVAVDIR